MEERPVDTRDSDSARRWRCGDVLRKKRGKRKDGRAENRRRTRKRTKRWRRWWRERRERERMRWRKTGGCEAAVKRGRVRVRPSQLAGRVDADRELKGWVDGRGRRGQGRRRREGRRESQAESGEKREGGGQEDRRKPGTSRFCYDQWQTGTQRAPFVSIQERLLRWTLRGVPLSPGSPHPSSPRILRLPRFSDLGRAAPCRATPYFPFVRAIYRSPFPRRVFRPFLYRLFSSQM